MWLVISVSGVSFRDMCHFEPFIFLNKNNYCMILQRSSDPHTSGLGAGFAVVPVYKALEKSGIVSFWDMMVEEDLL